MGLELDTYTHNNFAILMFSFTQGLKQILPGEPARFASTK